MSKSGNQFRGANRLAASLLSQRLKDYLNGLAGGILTVYPNPFALKKRPASGYGPAGRAAGGPGSPGPAADCNRAVSGVLLSNEKFHLHHADHSGVFLVIARIAIAKRGQGGGRTGAR